MYNKVPKCADEVLYKWKRKGKGMVAGIFGIRLPNKITEGNVKAPLWADLLQECVLLLAIHRAHEDSLLHAYGMLVTQAAASQH